MESTSVSKLACVLRENGDKVLNANSKLSLSASLLQNLNAAFSSIVEGDEDGNSSFQVVKTYNSKVDFLHDVQFLHDFVQKTVGIKIIHNPIGNVPLKGTLDISKFRALKFLELKKVPVTAVKGIQGIRGQLQCLVCIRCVQRLEDILSKCGADNTIGFTWSELREAVFNYNTIESLDSSLGYVPWVQIIDLSHNRLRDVAAIDCLPNLKYLNISYNLLDSVPTFNKSACRKMQVLILKNNYIEDVSGLASLENLSELDLSCNCLTDHSGLLPLLRLSSLVWLNLEGNPLSFHPKHRSYTTQYLHRNAAFEKFVLDRATLSKGERLLIGTTCNTPALQQAMGYGDNISYRSASSSATSSKTQVPEHVEPQIGSVLTKSQSSRKSKRVREAVISENNASIDGETDTLIGSLETSMDHLETKKQIETLRERFGEDNWLIQQSGSCIQEVLGFPSEKSRELSTSCLGTVEAIEEKFLKVESRPVAPITPVTLPDQTDMATESSSKEENILEKIEKSPSVESAVNVENVETEEEEGDEIEDDDEAEQQLYTVQRLRPGTQYIEELFLAVTERHLKERETSTGRTRERWAIDTLQSCLRISNSPVTVQLTFDTVRRDRQEREYIMDDVDAQSLVRILGNILDSRSLSAMNQIPYRCMKCSLQFSHEIDLKNITTGLIPGPMDNKLTCPSCGSTMVIEMDEDPLPTAQKPPDNMTQSESSRPLPQSPSQSSIGTSGGESLQVSVVVHQADVPSSPLQPVEAPIRSAASLESPNSTSTTVVQRYDSDIEVISNPSQSSIEVLAGESRTPGRKRSSEERQPVAVTQPEALVSPQSVGQALTLAGLTESSSSGSLTDSVCTTYENQMPSVPEEKNKMTVSESDLSGAIDIVTKNISESPSEKTGIFNKPLSPVKDFTTMFEGLLQSMSSKLMGNTPSIDRNQKAATNDSPVVYSYTDFSRIDHRIKLHLYQHILEGEHEELVLLLRATVLLYSSATPFPGCLVVSSSRTYVLKIAGPEGDDPEHWLLKVESFNLSQLTAVYVLPWNQGIGIEIQESSPRSILFLIQDQMRTSNFLSFLIDASLPKTCELRNEPPDYHQPAVDQLLLSSAPSGESDCTVRDLAIFNSCTISDEKESRLGLGALIVTASDLFLTQDDLHWLFPENTTRSLNAHRAQKMKDLNEVELNGLIVVLQFLDEAAGLEELWDLTFQTSSSIQTVIRAIQVPWEQLFSVPLQIINKTS